MTQAQDTTPQATPRPPGAAHKARQALAYLHSERTGLVAVATVAVLCLVLSLGLYDALGWPARTLTGIAARTVDGTCATQAASGFALWWCGLGLATVSVLGAFAVVVLLFLARRWIRDGLDAVAARAPAELRFLFRPVATTLLFAMAWAGVEFHFFDRPGLVPDGLFPAVIGTTVFALAWYRSPLERRLDRLLRAREALRWPVRIALVAATPIVLGFVATDLLHAPVRDQVIALVAVVGAWILLSARARGAAAPPARRTGAGALGLLLVVLALPTVAALGHCQNADWFTQNAIACEEAHHNGAMAAWGGVMAVGAAGVATVTTRPPREEETPAADPCQSLQDAFQDVRLRWMQANDAVQTMDRFIDAREREYQKRNESAFWSQATDVAFGGAAIGTRVAGAGGAAAATVWGRIAEASVETLKPMVVQHLLQQAFVEGNAFNALEAAHALANKGSHAAFVREVQHQLQNTLTSARAEELLKMGLKEGSPVFDSAMRAWATHAQTLADWVGDTVGVAGQATGIVGMAQEYGSLKDLMDRIHKLRMQRNDLVSERDELLDKVRPAKYALDNCRERVEMGLPPSSR